MGFGVVDEDNSEGDWDWHPIRYGYVDLIEVWELRRMLASLGYCRYLQQIWKRNEICQAGC